MNLINEIIEAKKAVEMWNDKGYYILKNGRLPLIAEGYNPHNL